MFSPVCLLASLFLSISLVSADHPPIPHPPQHPRPFTSSSPPPPGENKYDAYRAGILRGYSDSNNRFTVDLYHAMRKTHDSNFAVSPFSIFSMLSMVQLGTEGRTRKNIANALHARSLIDSGYQMYNESLELGQGENTTFMMAKAICTSRNFSPKTRFFNALTSYYDPKIFQYRTRRGEQGVNSWMSHQTNGMIPEILDTGDLSSHNLTLTSGMYFKALWKEAFHEGDTSIRTFKDDSGKSHDVLMMRRYTKLHARGSNSLDAWALKLPYKGDRYSLNLLVPYKSKGLVLEDVEKHLSHASLQEAFRYLDDDNSYGFKKFEVKVPRFGIDTSVDLEKVLEELGVSSMYTDTHRADFKPMSTGELGVKMVKHRCVLEVDEQGEPSGKSETKSYPEEVEFNRPFIFILRDDVYKINLMIGRYVSPQGDHVMV